MIYSFITIDAGDLSVAMTDNKSRLFSLLWVKAVKSRDGNVGFDDFVFQLIKWHFQLIFFLQKLVVLDY